MLCYVILDTEVYSHKNAAGVQKPTNYKKSKTVQQNMVQLMQNHPENKYQN